MPKPLKQLEIYELVSELRHYDRSVYPIQELLLRAADCIENLDSYIENTRWDFPEDL